MLVNVRAIPVSVIAMPMYVVMDVGVSWKIMAASIVAPTGSPSTVDVTVIALWYLSR